MPVPQKLYGCEHKYMSSMCVYSKTVLSIIIVSAVCEVYLDKDVLKKLKFQDTRCVWNQKHVSCWAGLTNEIFTLLKTHHFCKCW